MKRFAWARINVILKVTFTVVGLALLITWALTDEAIQSLKAANAYLVAGILLSQLAVFVFALRFRWVMRLAKVDLRVFAAHRLHLQSLFYYFFLPLGVGSELSKLAKLRGLHPDASKTFTLAAITLDRTIGLLTFLLLCLVAFPWVVPLAGVEVSTELWFALGVGFVLVAVAGYAGRRICHTYLPDGLADLVRNHVVHLTMAVGISLLMQLIMALAAYCAALAWGVELSYIQVLFVLSGSAFFQILPLSLAGIGGAELAGVTLYLTLGLEGKEALLMVSTTYAYRLLSALVGGVWELVDLFRPMPADPESESDACRLET